MKPRSYALVLLSVIPTFTIGQNQNNACDPITLHECIKMADPLVNDPKYVFPASIKDIDHVCNELFPQTWSEFVKCIDKYSASCLGRDQRSIFNRAVGESINSVHRMCTNEDYKQDYLQHAGCIRDRATEDDYCKKYYDQLTAQIKSDTPAGEMCCTHKIFKECVLEETRSCDCSTEDCQRNGETATQFAKTMLDKAHGFLTKQCESDGRSTASCPAYIPKRPRLEDVPTTQPPPEEEHYDGPNYFPSGSRYPEEPRPSTTEQPPPPPPQQQLYPDRTEDLLLPSEEEFRPSPVDPSTVTERETNGVEQRRGEAYEPRENDRSRKPWLPDTDIKDFNDFIENHLDHGIKAQGLGSSAGEAKSLSLLLAVSVAIIAFMN